jgi:hypothetical protein
MAITAGIGNWACVRFSLDRLSGDLLQSEGTKAVSDMLTASERDQILDAHAGTAHGTLMVIVRRLLASDAEREKRIAALEAALAVLPHEPQCRTLTSPTSHIAGMNPCNCAKYTSDARIAELEKIARIAQAAPAKEPA